MPKIYKYLGIIIYFYAHEHKPIHVHGNHGKTNENKAEIIIRDGQIVEVRIRSVKGMKPLKKKQLADFTEFCEKYKQQIVEKWISFFVYNIKPEIEEIRDL